MATDTMYELEEGILKCWNMVDDVKTVYAAICERDLTDDQIANMLLGLFELYDVKFQSLFDVLEKHFAERRAAAQKKSREL